MLFRSVVSDPIRAFERLLSKFGEFKTSCGFGVEREESGVEIFDEFRKGFLSASDGGVG